MGGEQLEEEEEIMTRSLCLTLLLLPPTLHLFYSFFVVETSEQLVSLNVSVPDPPELRGR